MISKTLKETLQNSVKFTVLALAITMLEKCVKIFYESGIGEGAISFIAVGLDRISTELKEGHKFIKNKEDFNALMKENYKKENKDEKNKG